MGELDAPIARMILGAARGLQHAAQDLEAQSVPLAPIDEGTLRGSAEQTWIVNGQRFEGDGAADAARRAALAIVQGGGEVDIHCEVSFNTVYAARQHEEVTWQHPTGGQAKYLEDPLRRMAGRYERAIGASVKAALNAR